VKHILRFLLFYLVVSCLAVLAAGYFSFPSPEMPYGGSDAYKLTASLLLFFEFLPAILCAGFICGASRVFGAEGKNYRARFSPAITAGFRQTVISAIVCVAIVFAAEEIGTPLLTNIQQKRLLQPGYVGEYLARARQHIDAGEFLLAEKYVRNALRIAPKSSVALELSERVEYGIAELEAREGTKIYIDLDKPPDPQIFPGEENYTAFELLQKAQDAYDKESWFDAHFYANTAMEITTERDPNYAAAKRIAAEAWNNVANPGAFADLQMADFFAKKREAYRALAERDDLKAYYLFENLRGRNADDTDIERYLNIASDRVREKYFFLSEVPDIESFSDIENVYFSIDKPNGKKDVVAVRGMAPLEDSGKVVIFLREMSILSYNAAGEFETSLYAPFAKMYAQPASDFDERTRLALGVDDDQNVPCIMLEGVDSRTGQIVMRPEFLFAGETPSVSRNLELLAMPYSDLILLIDSTRDIVPIVPLFQFAPIADKYGFSKEVFLHSLYTRIANPLIFVIVLLFSAIAAWNFRLAAQTYFKFLWILIPPILTVFVYPIIELIRFCVSVAIYTVIGISPLMSFGIIIAGFIVLFAVSALMFVSRRDAS
jgi:hypothetical protein